MLLTASGAVAVPVVVAVVIADADADATAAIADPVLAPAPPIVTDVPEPRPFAAESRLTILLLRKLCGRRGDLGDDPASP